MRLLELAKAHEAGTLFARHEASRVSELRLIFSREQSNEPNPGNMQPPPSPALVRDRAWSLQNSSHRAWEMTRDVFWNGNSPQSATSLAKVECVTTSYELHDNQVACVSGSCDIPVL